MADVTLADYLARWLQRRQSKITERTYLRYDSIVRNHLVPLIGELRLAEMRRRHVVELLDDLQGRRLAVNTVKGVVNMLRAACTSAVRDELIVGNPVVVTATDLGHPSTGQPFTRADQLTFFTQAPTVCRFAPFFSMLVLTGVRVSEGLGLQWPDVDLDRAELRVAQQFCRDTHRIRPTKGKQARTVDLCPEAIALLRAQPRLGPFVWASPKMEYLRPWHYESVRWDFRNGLLAAGLRDRRRQGYTIHSLRHTYATRLAEDGAEMRYIQEQLGHASIQMTADLYARSARTPRPDALDRLSVLPGPTTTH